MVHSLLDNDSILFINPRVFLKLERKTKKKDILIPNLILLSKHSLHFYFLAICSVPHRLIVHGICYPAYNEEQDPFRVIERIKLHHRMHLVRAILLSSNYFA